jgi:Prealbumin-like fold domain
MSSISASSPTRVSRFASFKSPLPVLACCVTLISPTLLPADSCSPFLTITVDPTNTAVGSTIDVAIGVGASVIDGGQTMQIDAVRYALDCTNSGLLELCTSDGEVIGDGIGNDDGACEAGEACVPVIAYVGDASLAPECDVEVLGDGIGDDDGVCEFGEACSSPSWSSNIPAGGAIPNELVFTPTPPLVIGQSFSAQCTLRFKVVVESRGTDDDPNVILGGGGFDGVCDTDPMLPAEARGTTQILLAEIAIEKVCESNDPDGTHPVSVTVRNDGVVLLQNCELSDTVFPDDRSCPPVGPPGPETLFPPAFDLPIGASRTVTTSVGPFAEDTCNTATVTCVVADSSAQVTATAFDECIPTGDLKIIKQDQDGVAMPGVGFVITGPTDLSCTTDTQGECFFPDVPVGQYTVVETLPDGYSLESCTPDEDPTTEGAQVTLSAGGEVIVTCVNCKLPAMVLRKVDTDGNPMPGVTLSISGPSGVGDCLTDIKGECRFGGLALGDYTVDEPTQPAGFVFLGCDPDNDPIAAGAQVTLDSDVCGAEKTVTCTNCELPDLCILKEDTLGNAMAGVRFVVDGPDAGECTTGQDGKCCLPGRSLGTYTITEPDLPPGFAFEGCAGDEDSNLAGTQVTLVAGDCGKEKAVSCTNCELPDLCVHKEDTLGIDMSGVGFEVTGPETRQCTTDANGDCCWTDLRAGDYTISEPNLPVGYAFVGCTPDGDDSTPGTQATLVCGDPLATVSCINCELPDLCVHKVDTLGNVMEGVGFEITGPETRQCTTDLSGDCCWIDLLPGVYTLSEPNLPTGYAFEECDRDDDLAMAGMQVNLECGDDINPPVTCTNCELPDVCIHKEDTQGNNMGDVPFSITGPETRDCTTDQNGDCCFYDLKAGEYTIEEPNLPGYALVGCESDENATTPSTQAVIECGDPLTDVACVNCKLPDICFFKTDENDIPMGDVTMVVTGPVTRDCTTDIDGNCCIEALPLGTYTISEPNPPLGYELDRCDPDDNPDQFGWQVVLDLEDCGEPSPVTCVDKLVPVCGDNEINRVQETCDGTAVGGPCGPQACRDSGTFGECTCCGDGRVNGGEECDDGNSDNEDDCDNNCLSQGCPGACPPVTKVKVDIWNENERRFSGTDRCIPSWDQVLLSRYTDGGPANHFWRSVLQTDKGKARLDGVASATRCGEDSIDVPLLGLASKVLTFNGSVARAGSGLIGMGREAGRINYLLDPVSSVPTAAGIVSVTNSRVVGSPVSASPISIASKPQTSGAVATSDAPTPGNRTSTTQKGSLLVFPKVELKWDASGNLIQDTFIELTNDYWQEVRVQMYFVHGDVCIWADNSFRLTPNQPSYWSVATGNPAGVSPFTVLGDRCPDRDPGNPGGKRLRGYVVAWAVESDTGAEIDWNHLLGDAVIVNYREASAWEYSPWAFQSLPDVEVGQTLLAPFGQLDLDGTEYQFAPDQLLLNFFASGTVLDNGASGTVSIDTDLTLWMALQDFRQPAD